MSEASPKFSQATLWATPSATSSPGSAGGATPSDSQTGPTTGPSGPAHAPASPSARPGSRRAKKTSGISGPISCGSSASVALARSLANRLRARLDSAGSTEYVQTWREKVTPLGRRYWAHTASGRRTSDRDCTGWPTPRVVTGGAESAERKQELGRTKSGGGDLQAAAQMVGWQTPTVQDAENNAGPSQWERNSKPLNVEAYMAGWPTPMAGTKATENYNEAGNTDSSRKTVQLTRGPLPYSSPAATERPAAYRLNPMFSLWLMGFPVSWGLAGCAAWLNSKKES